MSTSKAVLSLVILLCSPFAFAQEADLGVEKLGPGTATAGSDVSYTVTVFNAGPDDAVNAELSDPVPAGMSFVSATQDSGPTFTCDSTVNCTIATFPAGTSATFTFVFHIDAGTEFTNIASVSSETFDPNEENNSGTAFTVVTAPLADLAVVKSAVSASTPPNVDLTFFITLTNTGPAAAENVTLTDNLPAPLTFVSFTQTSGPTFSCGTSTCTIASFPAGATATFELTGHVPNGTPAGTEITNTVTVTSDNDPSDENNASTTTVVVATADVRVVKTGPSSAVAGTTISYDVTVTNDGPDVALNVQVLDPQFCVTTNCDLGSMAPGASQLLTGSVTIDPDATSWSNTATVSTDSFDPDSSDNSSTWPTTITQSADLVVTKTGPATVDAGASISWTVTVANNGPSTASNVTVTDTLPAGVTFVSSTCGTLACNLGALSPGAPVQLTFTGNVPSSASGPITNSVTASTSTPDPDSGNNTDTADTTVTQSADVSVVKSGPASVVATSDITWTITVTNDGPSDAASVSLDDTMPPQTTFVSSSCGAFPCSLGTLTPGQSAVVTLVANVPLGTTGPITNTASVTTATPDPASANNTSSAVSNVGAAPADLSVTKTADRQFALPGEQTTYTIVVSNAGPGEATDVVVTDTLPAGMTLVSSSGSCSGSPTVTCTVGTLAAGGSVTIELVVTLPPTPGTVTNTAIVSASTPDSESANDSGTAAITVSARLPAVPTLSPLALALLALSLAAAVLVMLRSA